METLTFQIEKIGATFLSPTSSNRLLLYEKWRAAQ